MEILEKGTHGVGAEHTTSLWVDIAEVDLDGGLVLGADQAVRGGALAGDVQVDNFTFIVLHGSFCIRI